MQSKRVPSTVLVLGGPGSGKGTHCTLIARTFGFVHLSAGELMRKERESGSSLGQHIKEVDEKGELLTGDVVLQVLDKTIDQHMSEGRDKFLLDGFPRSEENVTAFRKWKEGGCPPKFALFLDCPDEVMKSRLLGRGNAGSGRWDDMDVAVIEKRISNYHSQTEPVIRFYGSAEGGNIIKHINSNQGSVEQVFADVEKAFVDEGFTKV